MQSKLSALSLCQSNLDEEINGGGGAKRRRERAQKWLALGRREQHCGSTDIPTPLTTILLKRLLILLIRSAASAAIQRVAICALISQTHNPNWRRLVGQGQNSLHLLGWEETRLHVAGSPSFTHPCPLTLPLPADLSCNLRFSPSKSG